MMSLVFANLVSRDSALQKPSTILNLHGFKCKFKVVLAQCCISISPENVGKPKVL